MIWRPGLCVKPPVAGPVVLLSSLGPSAECVRCRARDSQCHGQILLNGVLCTHVSILWDREVYLKKPKNV